MRDVTRPVRLSVEPSGVTRREFTARVTTRIDRTEFGVTASRGLAGRYLDLTMEIRCVRDSGGRGTGRRRIGRRFRTVLARRYSRGPGLSLYNHVLGGIAYV